MSDRAVDAERRLPCGRDIGTLLTYLVDGRPADLAAHVRGCPHCQAELKRLERTWSPVHNAANAPVKPPPGVVERALSTVRAIRASSSSAPVEMAQEGGSLTVSASSVLALVRAHCADVLDDYPGAHLRGCTADATEIRVDVAIRYPLPAWNMADDIRSRLDHAVRSTLGAGTPSLWVRVSDIATPSGE